MTDVDPKLANQLDDLGCCPNRRGRMPSGQHARR
jgi:hypothetical protein